MRLYTTTLVTQGEFCTGEGQNDNQRQRGQQCLLCHRQWLYQRENLQGCKDEEEI